MRVPVCIEACSGLVVSGPATNAGDTALSETFTYDSVGNLLTRPRLSASGAFTYPLPTAARPHAPLTLGARAFAYDGNGNTTGDGVRTLAWNEANHLGSVVMPGPLAVSFAYGPDTARSRKAVAGGASTLYPTADVEYAVGAATPFTRYPHMDVKVAGAAKQFLHRDHLASVRLVTDASGNVVEGTGYAAYGERLNTAMQTQKGYIGERHGEAGRQTIRWIVCRRTKPDCSTSTPATRTPSSALGLAATGPSMAA